MRITVFSFLMREIFVHTAFVNCDRTSGAVSSGGDHGFCRGTSKEIS